MCPAVYAVCRGHGLIKDRMLIGREGRLGADWLAWRWTADWLIRMRLCKQIPSGHHDIIRLEGIPGYTPLEYISRANGLI